MDILSSKRFRMNTENAKWKGQNEDRKIKERHNMKDVKL